MVNVKEIVKHLVERVGGPAAAAALLGVSKTEISYWGNQDHPRTIPARHLAVLDAAGGDLFLKAQASDRGYDLVKRETQAETVANVFKTLGKLSKDSGAFEGVMLDALADHNLTPSEKRIAREHLRPVKDSLELVDKILA